MFRSTVTVKTLQGKGPGKGAAAHFPASRGSGITVQTVRGCIEGRNWQPNRYPLLANVRRFCEKGNTIYIYFTNRVALGEFYREKQLVVGPILSVLYKAVYEG